MHTQFHLYNFNVLDVICFDQICFRNDRLVYELSDDINQMKMH